MIRAVVGTKVYNVWVDMLRCLVPHGRTHRLSVVVAGMLQYTYELAHRNVQTNAHAKKLLEMFEYAFENDDEGIKEIFKIAESLFDAAGVRCKRRNRRGEVYSIAEDAAYEFLSWDSMPWER